MPKIIKHDTHFKHLDIKALLKKNYLQDGKEVKVADEHCKVKTIVKKWYSVPSDALTDKQKTQLKRFLKVEPQKKMIRFTKTSQRSKKREDEMDTNVFYQEIQNHFQIPVAVGYALFGKPQVEKPLLHAKLLQPNRFKFKAQYRVLKRAGVEDFKQEKTVNQAVHYLQNVMPRGIVNMDCGMGKCFSRDTYIQIYNDRPKPVQQIEPGDRVVGVCGEPKYVHNVNQGTETMYTISVCNYIHKENTNEKLVYENVLYRYTVNRSHILCLIKKNNFTDTKNITVKEYLQHMNKYEDYCVYFTKYLNNKLRLCFMDQIMTFATYTNDLQFQQFYDIFSVIKIDKLQKELICHYNVMNGSSVDKFFGNNAFKTIDSVIHEHLNVNFNDVDAFFHNMNWKISNWVACFSIILQRYLCKYIITKYFHLQGLSSLNSSTFSINKSFKLNMKIICEHMPYLVSDSTQFRALVNLFKNSGYIVDINKFNYVYGLNSVTPKNSKRYFENEALIIEDFYKTHGKYLSQLTISLTDNFHDACNSNVNANYMQQAYHISHFKINKHPVCSQYYGFTLQDNLDRRFLLENGNVVHNTSTMLAVASKLRTPTLFIVHVRTLMQQGINDCVKMFDNVRIGKIHGKDRDIEDFDVVFTMRVTLDNIRLEDPELFKRITNYFELIIIDECHTVTCSTYIRLLRNLDAKYVIGCSATAYKLNGLSPLIHFQLGSIMVKETLNLPIDIHFCAYQLDCPDNALVGGLDRRDFKNENAYLRKYSERRLKIEEEIMHDKKTIAQMVHKWIDLVQTSKGIRSYMQLSERVLMLENSLIYIKENSLQLFSLLYNHPDYTKIVHNFRKTNHIDTQLFEEDETIDEVNRQINQQFIKVQKNVIEKSTKLSDQLMLKTYNLEIKKTKQQILFIVEWHVLNENKEFHLFCKFVYITRELKNSLYELCKQNHYLLGTSQIIGTGYDTPRKDTGSMTFFGKDIKQPIGRLQRPYVGKEEPLMIIYHNNQYKIMESSFYTLKKMLTPHKHYNLK